MPRKACTSKGKRGVKWGNKGKCYTGKGAESKMNKQRRAIKASQSRRRKK